VICMPPMTPRTLASSWQAAGLYCTDKLTADTVSLISTAQSKRTRARDTSELHKVITDGEHDRVVPSIVSRWTMACYNFTLSSRCSDG